MGSGMLEGEKKMEKFVTGQLVYFLLSGYPRDPVKLSWMNFLAEKYPHLRVLSQILVKLSNILMNQ